VVETLAGEQAQVFRTAGGQVDAPFGHHPDRVGVQRLRAASRAVRLDQAARLRNGQGLSYLRPGTVAGAQEQQPDWHAARRPSPGIRGGGNELEARMHRLARLGQ
jgi:hypothetical protein